MKVVVKEPNKEPEIKEVEDSLKTWQELVGGYIQAVDFKDNIIIILDEEGRLKDKEPNFSTPKYGVLVGTCVFIGTEGEEFIGLTDEQAEDIISLFE